MRVAKLKIEDIPEVLETAEECGLCIWSAEAYRAEIGRDDSIMFKAVDEGGRFAGFAVGRFFDFGNGQKSVELTNIGIRKTLQQQGFGSLLLKFFLDRCRTVRAGFVVLEARISNRTAIRFYERFGFKAAGRRKGFYSNPTEDAVTMRLDLKASVNAQEFILD
jgi:ribosomal protein S18 acetylase RimI-like enzyme